MAASQCLKCGNRSFESVAKIPIGSPRRFIFIQCSVCGSVVGVQEERIPAPRNNPEPADQKKELVRSSYSSVTAVPADINTVLKQLYG